MRRRKVQSRLSKTVAANRRKRMLSNNRKSYRSPQSLYAVNLRLVTPYYYPPHKALLPVCAI